MLSNIPSGCYAINKGIAKRVEIGKDLALLVEREFSEYKPKTDNTNNEPKPNEVQIYTNSFGNLFGAKLAKELAKQSRRIDNLCMMGIASLSLSCFQSVDDIANELDCAECKNCISQISIPEMFDESHPKENEDNLRQLLIDKGFSNVSKKYQEINGDIYEVEYDDNLRVIKGTCYYPNGDVYKGYFLEDYTKNGKGCTLNFAKANCKYTGEFKDDYINGEGVFTTQFGVTLTGKFKTSFPNGTSEVISFEGDVINGKKSQEHKEIDNLTVFLKKIKKENNNQKIIEEKKQRKDNPQSIK